MFLVVLHKLCLAKPAQSYLSFASHATTYTLYGAIESKLISTNYLMLHYDLILFVFAYAYVCILNEMLFVKPNIMHVTYFTRTEPSVVIFVFSH